MPVAKYSQKPNQLPCVFIKLKYSQYKYRILSTFLNTLHVFNYRCIFLNHDYISVNDLHLYICACNYIFIIYVYIFRFA